MRRVAAAAALLLAACSTGGGDAKVAVPTSNKQTTTSSTATTTTTAPATTTTTRPRLPAVDQAGAGVLVTPKGFVLPIEGGGPGAWTVMTPCAKTAIVHSGTTIGGATVVLDPGHGGEESGAVGPGGLAERTLNLAVAQKAKAALEHEGATVVLTRTGDYRISIQTRAEIGQKLKPPVFISIHHNGGNDEVRDTPGTEVYFQIASPTSKRLAGILYEEQFRFFSTFKGIHWFSDRDAGAKYRPSQSGGDYYGMLRRTNGVTAVLSEAAFLSNGEEEAILAKPEVQHGEAEAITRAVRRYILGTDPGSGFVDPYPRTEPAGPGGGTSGCEDPPLE